MKTEKAIEDIKFVKSHLFYNNDLDIFIELKTLDLAVEALEKQIPKKILISEFTKSQINHYGCPTCGRIFWEKSYIDDYCDSCGQRLDRDNSND